MGTAPLISGFQLNNVPINLIVFLFLWVRRAEKSSPAYKIIEKLILVGSSVYRALLIPQKNKKLSRHTIGTVKNQSVNN